MKKSRKQDKWDERAEHIVGLSEARAEDHIHPYITRELVPLIAAALRRVAKAKGKTEFDRGYSIGFDKGYSQGYDEQMKARVLDAMERKK